VQGQVAADLEVLRAGRLDLRRDEGDLRVLGDVQEVGAAQMVVPLVSTLAASISASIFERLGSASSAWTVPETFPNSPRTLLTIRWRTENWTLVCAGSRSQVAAVAAAGSARAAVAMAAQVGRVRISSPPFSSLAPPAAGRVSWRRRIPARGT